MVGRVSNPPISPYPNHNLCNNPRLPTSRQITVQEVIQGAFHNDMNKGFEFLLILLPMYSLKDGHHTQIYSFLDNPDPGYCPEGSSQ
jgi:hypothetical protein